MRTVSHGRGRQLEPRWSNRWCCCLAIKWNGSSSEGQSPGSFTWRKFGSQVRNVLAEIGEMEISLMPKNINGLHKILLADSTSSSHQTSVESQNRTWLQRFTSHWIYENVMSFLIVANSLILGLQVPCTPLMLWTAVFKLVLRETYCFSLPLEKDTKTQL